MEVGGNCRASGGELRRTNMGLLSATAQSANTGKHGCQCIATKQCVHFGTPVISIDCNIVILFKVISIECNIVILFKVIYFKCNIVMPFKVCAIVCDTEICMVMWQMSCLILILLVR